MWLLVCSFTSTLKKGARAPTIASPFQVARSRTRRSRIHTIPFKSLPKVTMQLLLIPHWLEPNYIVHFSPRESQKQSFSWSLCCFEYKLLSRRMGRMGVVESNQQPLSLEVSGFVQTCMHIVVPAVAITHAILLFYILYFCICCSGMTLLHSPTSKKRKGWALPFKLSKCNHYTYMCIYSFSNNFPN